MLAPAASTVALAGAPAAAADRFAGADIDAMLDVVDRSHDDPTHVDGAYVNQGAAQDADAASPGLDAIA